MRTVAGPDGDEVLRQTELLVGSTAGNAARCNRGMVADHFEPHRVPPIRDELRLCVSDGGDDAGLPLVVLQDDSQVALFAAHVHPTENEYVLGFSSGLVTEMRQTAFLTGWKSCV